jgi:hypothetical protein
VGDEKDAGTHPPEESTLSRLTRRQVFKAGAGALVDLSLPEILLSGVAAQPCGPDPILDIKKVGPWFYRASNTGIVRRENDLLELYPGESAFDRIRMLADSDQSYIYLLGWWFTDSFALQAGDDNTTMHNLLKRASDDKIQVRAMIWWPDRIYDKCHWTLTQEVARRNNMFAPSATS